MEHTGLCPVDIGKHIKEEMWYVDGIADFQSET